MGLVHDTKIKLFKRGIDKALKESIYTINSQLLEDERLIGHCYADKLTPEESALHIMGTLLSDLNFDNLYSTLKTARPSGKHKHITNDRKGEWWFWVAKKWRDEGKVERSRLDEFLDKLQAAKLKWPQLFTSEKLETKSYWEVHFNSHPRGLNTDKPAESYGNAFVPISKFFRFYDAVEFVDKQLFDDVWWHYYDLGKVERSLSCKQIGHHQIPAWEANYPEEENETWGPRGRSDYYFGGGLGGTCLSAMPKSAYDQWLKAIVSDENLDLRNDTVIIPPQFQNVWLIRKVYLTFYVEFGETKVKDYEWLDLSTIKTSLD